MKVTLGVPERWRKTVAGFAGKEGLPIAITGEDNCTIKIADSEESRESVENTLYAGGWIRCSVARRLSVTLGTTEKKTGALLNLLNIKIRDCELGCF